jgi:hypothetical protein
MLIVKLLCFFLLTVFLELGINCDNNITRTIQLANKIKSHYQLKPYVNHLLFSPYKLCLPNIFFIGFPKAGTTYLNDLLIKHPHVQRVRKEPHFFTRRWINGTLLKQVIYFYKYLDIYRTACSLVIQKSRTVLMDASQSTSWETRSDIDIPTFLYSLNPNMRILIETRDPFDRILSDFYYFNGNTERSERSFPDHLNNAITAFEDCFSAVDKRLPHSATMVDYCYCAYNPPNDLSFFRIHISMYFCHIHRWLAVVPSSSIHVVNFEDLNLYLPSHLKGNISSNSHASSNSIYSVNLTIFHDVLRFLSLPVNLYNDSLLIRETNNNVFNINNNKHNKKYNIYDDISLELEMSYFKLLTFISKYSGLFSYPTNSNS